MIGCTWFLVDWPKVKSEWKILSLITFCGVASVGLSLIPVFWKSQVGLIFGTALFYLTTLAFIWAAYRVFPTTMIGKVAFYMLLMRVQRPSMEGALDYFYTSTCLHGGPQLSVFYFVTVLGLVSACASVVGLALYQIFLKTWTFRSVVFVTVILNAIGSASDLFVVTRLNVRLGVPDAVAVMLGDAVIQPIVAMLNWIPGSILIRSGTFFFFFFLGEFPCLTDSNFSQSCPKGLESSVFAFLAGISNLSLSGSKLTGALVMQLGQIDSSERVCNYASLPLLVLVCHVISPIVIGCASAFLLPNKPQTERLE